MAWEVLEVSTVKVGRGVPRLLRVELGNWDCWMVLPQHVRRWVGGIRTAGRTVLGSLVLKAGTSWERGLGARRWIFKEFNKRVA